ncbi:MAG: metal-dependent hydrolase [Thermotoga sp.]|nr:MAG: metal-dependent hydrolase [Thermotoga sp.]
MKITFLGTGAFEGFPNPFCICSNCEASRNAKSEDLRLRTSVLINDDLLIDFGPDIVASCQKIGIDLVAVRTLLITHSHADHLYLSNFRLRQPDFCNSWAELPEMTVVTHNSVARRIQEDNQYFEGARVKIIGVDQFVPIEINDYAILPLKANHKVSEDETPLLYLIIDGDGKSLFYGTDTGILPVETIDNLCEYMGSNILSAVVLDGTMGFPGLTYPYHLDFFKLLETVKSLGSRGIISSKTKVISTHFSHNQNPIHKELKERYSGYNIITSYDGLTLKI